MKMCGLDLLREDLCLAVQRGASITIYSSQKETKPECVVALAEIGGIQHYSVGTVYFHPKLYYGRTCESFVAILGSANLTKGGLQSNEELSCLMEGDVAGVEHRKLLDYLERLSQLQNFHSTPISEKQSKKLKFKPVHKILKRGTDNGSTVSPGKSVLSE